jgi:NTP pyrophosphatase (non-canonical NTP hydrolase)
MDITTFQETIAATYGARDCERGISDTIAWLTEEIGELAQAVRKGTREQQLHELGDVIAWVASLAAQLDLSLDTAASRYAGGCPSCGTQPCTCP